MAVLQSSHKGLLQLVPMRLVKKLSLILLVILATTVVWLFCFRLGITGMLSTVPLSYTNADDRTTVTTHLRDRMISSPHNNLSIKSQNTWVVGSANAGQNPQLLPGDRRQSDIASGNSDTTTFLGDTTRLHHNITKLHSDSQRMIIYYCNNFCGGWADRVRGIEVAYVIANLTNRKLGIWIPRMSCNLTSFLLPHEVDWNFPLSARDLADAVKFKDLGHGFTKNLSRVDLEVKFPQRVVFFATLGLAYHIKKNARYWNQTVWMRNLTADQIHSHIYKRLFRLAPDVQKELDLILARAKPASGSRLVCAHLRMANSGQVSWQDSEYRHTFAHGDTVFKFLLQFDDVQRTGFNATNVILPWNRNSTVAKNDSKFSNSESKPKGGWFPKENWDTVYDHDVPNAWTNDDANVKVKGEREGDATRRVASSLRPAFTQKVASPEPSGFAVNAAGGAEASNVRFFIASDSQDYVERAKVLFGDRLITVEGKIVHVDKATREAACDGFKRLLLDQELLTHCDVLVVSRSGFGNQAAFRRGTSRGLFCMLVNGTLVKCSPDKLFDIYYPGR